MASSKGDGAADTADKEAKKAAKGEKKKKEGVAANPMAADDGRWMTPERYRRIGKYMKPWGKPPTGVTFWVQLLTTAAVIIISIFKGVDSSVELVVSYGVPEYQQKQAPENLAFGIVFLLTCGVALFGYLFMRFQEWRLTKQMAAEAAAEEAEKEARAQAKAQAKAEAEAKAKAAAAAAAEKPKPPAVAPEAEKAAAAPASASPPSPTKVQSQARLEMSLQKMAAEGNAQLQAAMQQIVEEGQAQGLSQDEMQMRIMMVRQSHAQHMKNQVEMVREMEGARQKALADGATEEEADARAKQCANFHQRKMQLQAQQQKALRAVHQEATSIQCPQMEVNRRIQAMQEINRQQMLAMTEQNSACMAAEAEAIKEGLGPDEVLAKVQEVAKQCDETWNAKKASMMKNEDEIRKEMQLMFSQRKDDSLPAEIREMLLARVRIHDLQAKPELNGRCGVAKCYVTEKERFAVSVDVEKGEKPIDLLLKPSNLTIITKVDADGKEIDDDAAPPPLD